jgi:large subunit ribosomal protein L6
MSRVGRKVIAVPAGVKVSISEAALEVQGPKGKLTTPVPPGIRFALQGQELSCQRASDERQLRAFHGMARALAQNAIKGVTEGFSRDLDIVGVGYRAAVEGSKVVFALGFSHPVEFPIPEGIKIAVDKQTRVTVSGIDRQKVGQVAAEIRRLRRPDPYKQKGIRYVGEVLKKKAGKAGATGAKGGGAGTPRGPTARGNARR